MSNNKKTKNPSNSSTKIKSNTHEKNDGGTRTLSPKKPIKPSK